MDHASAVIKSALDPLLLEQIDALRLVRLGIAENMLIELDATISALSNLGVVNLHNSLNERNELRSELKERIAILRNRLGNPSVVYEDELEFYSQIIEDEADIVDSIDEDFQEP